MLLEQMLSFLKNLVSALGLPRAESTSFPGGGKMRDPGNEVGVGWGRIGLK